MKRAVKLAAMVARENWSKSVAQWSSIVVTPANIWARGQDVEVFIDHASPGVVPIVVDHKQLLAATKTPGPVASDGHTLKIGGHTLPSACSTVDMPGPICGTGAFSEPVDLPSDAIEYVLRAVSMDVTRYTLQGVYFHGSSIVATDTHRMHVVDLGHAGQWNAIVPALALEVALAAKAPITIAFGNGCARLTAGDVEITARLIDGQFPNYKMVIPKKWEQRAIMPAQPLTRALDAVTASCRAVKDKVTGANIIVNGSCRIDGDHYKDNVPAESTGDHAFRINARYLSEAVPVRNKNAARDVRVSFIDDSSPLVVEQNPGYLAVVMPMKG